MCDAANVVGTVASDSIGERQQSLAQACAVVHGYASQRSVQSSDSIHIQVEPLHSMDSYAAKLMSPGLEVAIYSGRCPLTMLATYHPAPQLVQHQVCPENVLYVCSILVPGSNPCFWHNVAWPTAFAQCH